MGAELKPVFKDCLKAGLYQYSGGPKGPFSSEVALVKIMPSKQAEMQLAAHRCVLAPIVVQVIGVPSVVCSCSTQRELGGGAGETRSDEYRDGG